MGEAEAVREALRLSAERMGLLTNIQDDPPTPYSLSLIAELLKVALGPEEEERQAVRRALQLSAERLGIQQPRKEKTK